MPPADIVSDIKAWRELRSKPASVDVVIAVEVIEHVDLVDEAYALLQAAMPQSAEILPYAPSPMLPLCDALF